MLEYFIRMILLVPLMGGLAWASLWLWKKAQIGLPGEARASGALRVVDALPLGQSGKLILVECRGREYLISASRTGIAAVARVEDQRA
jgi:flagellar protein FliO/FliZ